MERMDKTVAVTFSRIVRISIPNKSHTGMYIEKGASVRRFIWIDTSAAIPTPITTPLMVEAIVLETASIMKIYASCAQTRNTEYSL